jgi:hypothetical protein
MLTVPLPRYVTAACCDDTNHVSNRQDPDFFREISGSEKSLSDAAAAGALTSEAKILNILEFFGPLEFPLQELATVDGTSIWAGDGVHLTSNATRVAATRLMKNIAGGGETQEPATKRARLESVIPMRPAPHRLQRPHSRPRRRRQSRYCPRCGCPASCRRTSAGPTTSEVSRAEGGAATSQEEASRRPGEGPTPGECPEAGPEAAAQAAGAGGRAKHERVFVPLLFFNMKNGNCDTDSVLEKPTESEAN